MGTSKSQEISAVLAIGIIALFSTVACFLIKEQMVEVFSAKKYGVENYSKQGAWTTSQNPNLGFSFQVPSEMQNKLRVSVEDGDCSIAIISEEDSCNQVTIDFGYGTITTASKLFGKYPPSRENLPGDAIGITEKSLREWCKEIGKLIAECNLYTTSGEYLAVKEKEIICSDAGRECGTGTVRYTILSKHPIYSGIVVAAKGTPNEKILDRVVDSLTIIPFESEE